MSEQQEYIIKELSELDEQQQLTDKLYKSLVSSLADYFRLSHNEARKVVISTLRTLYAQ
jgi:hypothetical protein